MSVMENIFENIMIEKITKNFLKAPHKLNQIHEADAEIIDLGNGCKNCLAVTTDTLAEEVEIGLYDDPYLAGWMLVMVNFSDLAAVGADQLGLVISINYPPDKKEQFIEKLTEGISDACRELNTYVLGGDTNQARELFLSGCALGVVPKDTIITRIGAKPKDKIYLTGRAGLGSILAFLKLSKNEFPLPELFFKPVARIKEGKIMREFASSCMDTSDGVIHTVDTLMRLNHCQIILNDDWNNILHPTALEVCRAYKLPLWLVLAGVHGEFELCFTVSPDKEKSFLLEADKSGWAPILIGEVGSGEGVNIRSENRLVSIDTALIRNLSQTAGSDPEGYIRNLIDYALELKI